MAAKAGAANSAARRGSTADRGFQNPGVQKIAFDWEQSLDASSRGGGATPTLARPRTFHPGDQRSSARRKSIERRRGSGGGGGSASPQGLDSPDLMRQLLLENARLKAENSELKRKGK